MSQKNGFFQEEKIRQSKILERYNRLKDKHLDNLKNGGLKHMESI